jgi:hypothetical protein
MFKLTTMIMKKLITERHRKKRGDSSEKNSAISLNEGVEGLCKMWKEKKV